jgi:hypothetical protein
VAAPEGFELANVEFEPSLRRNNPEIGSKNQETGPVLSALPPKLTSAHCGQMSAMYPQRTESSRGRAAYAVTPRSPDGGTFVSRRDRIGG